MPQTTRRKLLALAGLAPFAGGLLASRDAEAELAAAPPSPRERIHKLYFPDVVLRTQDDQPVRFYDDLVKDKVVTINFFYAQCEKTCPLVMANLARVQRLLGDQVGRDLFMISVSLEPEKDTPAVLKAYAGMHQARPGWTFLTGKLDDVERLRRSLGFTNPNPRVDKDIEQHIGNVRYGNEPLMLWAACPGQARPEWIAESLAWVIHPGVQKVVGPGA
jgi:protein SCO1